MASQSPGRVASLLIGKSPSGWISWKAAILSGETSLLIAVKRFGHSWVSDALLALCFTDEHPVHFEHAILRRAQRRFDFRSGSIGNFWLAGVQLFVRSLQSAIFLFSSVCGIESKHSVIPAINTNSLVTIAAELADGSRLVGQNEISHPSPGSEQPLHGSYTPSSGHWTPAIARSQAGSRISQAASTPPQLGEDLDYDDSSGVLARTEHDLSLENDTEQGETAWDQPRRDEQPHHSSNIIFTKPDEGYPPLPARISRIIYLNTYGQETFPAPSSAYLQSLQNSDYLVYSCGSLYTSLIPPLALSGVGNTIAMSKFRAKILLLNGSFDRETDGMTAVDFVSRSSRKSGYCSSLCQIEAVTSHLNGSIRTPAQKQPANMHLHPDLHIRPTHRFAASDYITHVLYLESASIQVDRLRLQVRSLPNRGSWLIIQTADHEYRKCSRSIRSLQRTECQKSASNCTGWSINCYRRYVVVLYQTTSILIVEGTFGFSPCRCHSRSSD